MSDRLTAEQIPQVIHQLWSDAVEWQDTYLDDVRKLDVKNSHRKRLLRRKDDVIAALLTTARREAKYREALEQIATCVTSPASRDYLSPEMAKQLARTALEPTP